MTERRSDRGEKEKKTLKRTSRWAVPLQAFNLVLFKVCSESPHMRGARKNKQGESRAALMKKKGGSSRGKNSNFLNPEWTSMASTTRSPFPKNSITHCTRTHTHKHTEQIINIGLRGKSGGPRRVIPPMCGVLSRGMGEGKKASYCEPQERLRPFLSMRFGKARTDGADSV